MGIPLLAEIERLIVERGSAAVLRERLLLVNEQYVLLENKVAKLEAECSELRRKLVEAEQERTRQAALQQFTEHRGALFKKGPGGTYIDTMYCPVCRQSTDAFPPGDKFVCQRCSWFSAFTEDRLAAVIAELG